jgi:hypothetical protein
MNAKDCLQIVAVSLDERADPRSLALARTLRELCAILGEAHTAGAIASGFLRLHGIYGANATTDAERARGATCWDIGQACERVMAEANVTAGATDRDAYEVWDALVTGLGHAWTAAPIDAKPRYAAMIATYEREAAWLLESAPLGGFTPRTGPSNPGTASFDAAQ